MGAEEITLAIEGMRCAPVQLEAWLIRQGLVVLRGTFDELITTGGQGVCVWAALGSRVTVKYAVCHPPSADVWFFALVETVGATLGGTVTCPGPSPRGFDVWQWALGELVEKRRYWHLFGPQQAAVTPDEAWRRVLSRQNHL